ncbi:MAG: hypothetical protein AAB646_02975 [Patescibacteria group bacterium]
MTTKVSKRIETKTRVFIVEAVKDIVSDPDFGLELTKKAEKRLKQARGIERKTFLLSEIKKKYS